MDGRDKVCNTVREEKVGTTVVFRARVKLEND